LWLDDDMIILDGLKALLDEEVGAARCMEAEEAVYIGA